LAVAEGKHGLGIGRKLIQSCVLRAHARGVRRVFAFTLRERLFLQLGFHPVPVTEFPQKVVTDYHGLTLAAERKSAVLVDLERWTGWETSPLARKRAPVSAAD